MNIKYLLFKIAAVILSLSLVLTCMPTGQVAAKPVPKLTVDVWTDKGGEGPNTSGGGYTLGEKPVIFFKANIGCQVKLTLSGPDGTNHWEQPAMYGPVYQVTLGTAEQVDIGRWEVVLDARTTSDGQNASDTTWFTITSGSTPVTPPQVPQPPPTPQPQPGPTPPATGPVPEPYTEPVDAITRNEATELDALRALKMAGGSLSEDLTMDADGDSQVTAEDARLILQWVLGGRAKLELERHVVTMEMVAPYMPEVPVEVITGLATPDKETIIATDDMKLIIPRGAVAEDTEIVLKKLKGIPPLPSYKKEYALAPWVMGIGTTYDFGPEGLEFSQPVQIVLSYDEDVLPSGAEEMNIIPAYYNGADWIGMPAVVDTEQNTVTIRTSSFPGQFVTITAWGITKALMATGSALAVWYYGGGGKAIVSQFAKDPIYNGKAAEYIQPNDPVVEDYARKVLVEVASNKYGSFSDEAELAEMLKKSVVGSRLIRFDFGRIKKGPVYKISDDWVNDWLKPADYVKGGMEGDCKNIANFYCSVLRKLNINAKCVDGFKGTGRHVWVELEISDKAYYVGDSGELVPLDETVKELKLTRPKGVKGQGFMWDENGQVRYKENWWRQGSDLSQAKAVKISLSVNKSWKHHGDAGSKAFGPTAERLCRQTLGSSGDGRWVSKNIFVSTWDTKTPGSGLTPPEHKTGEITVIFDADDLSHIKTVSCRSTTEALTDNVEPRKRTVIIEAGDLGLLTQTSYKVTYGIQNTAVCDGKHVSSIRGTRLDYQDGSWSEVISFDCNTTGGIPVLYITFKIK